MTKTDSIPALDAELTAALAVLEPQIRGLADIMVIPASAGLTADIQASLAAHTRRRDLIAAAAAALEALAADGYPNPVRSLLAAESYRELTAQILDQEAALAGFAVRLPSQITMNLDAATVTEQAAPIAPGP